MLLFIDALSAALGVASALPGLFAHGAPALAAIALRGATGALEATAAWLLLGDRLSGVPIARLAVVLAAVYATLGVGLRLAPTNLDPAARMPVVAGYWAYALVVLTLLRRA